MNDVLVLPAIVGAVNLAKELGATGKVLTVISVIIGTVFVTASQVLPEGAASMIFKGVLGGLGAAGLYDLSRLFGGK